MKGCDQGLVSCNVFCVNAVCVPRNEGFDPCMTLRLQGVLFSSTCDVSFRRVCFVVRCRTTTGLSIIESVKPFTPKFKKYTFSQPFKEKMHK